MTEQMCVCGHAKQQHNMGRGTCGAMASPSTLWDDCRQYRPAPSPGTDTPQPPADTQQDDEPVCACGLNLNIWQNSWNHRPGCSMKLAARSSANKVELDRKMASALERGMPTAQAARAVYARQDDERLTATTCPRWHRDPDGWCIDERPHLAARPSADTETLRLLGFQPAPWRLADNLPYVNQLSSYKDQLQVEGSDAPSCEDDPQPPVEVEVLGVDYRTACAARLGGDAGRLAVLHWPIYGRPPTCDGCRPGGPPRQPDVEVEWPCTTAELALGMMRLTASDIAITQKE